MLGLDAALWLVPWGALPVEEGRYAVEDHLIHFVISGRDQLAPPPAGKSGVSAIFADPDYDLAQGKAWAIAQERGKIPLAGGGATAMSPIARDLSKMHADRLPATRSEAEAIAPSLKQITGTDIELNLDGEASETAFKALRSPKVLVLSTHGFFGGPETDAGGKPSPAGPLDAKLPSNPLLRCGLLFAGFNQRASAPSAKNLDDGVVTGLEVMAADLRGTELVVLSACETARGEVEAGEGVAGLRQVFQIAGAGSVVATLWKVADDESYQLMDGFFQGLARRRGPAVALREAQLAMIGDRRARFGAAHPFYWAAYTLTGFPGSAWREVPLTSVGSAELPHLPPPLSGADREPGGQGARAVGPISPATGRRGPDSRWPDGALTLALLSGGSFLARWWWLKGGAVRP